MVVKLGYCRCCDGVNKVTHQVQVVSTGGEKARALLRCRAGPSMGEAGGERRGVTIISLMKDTMAYLPGVVACSPPKV